MKLLIRKCFPSLKGDVIEFFNKIYDLYIFYKYSFHKKILQDKEKQQAFLIKQYHIVEKGLSLPNPRPGFGVQKISELLTIASYYVEKYGPDYLTNSIASSLREYLGLAERENYDIDDVFFNRIKRFLAISSENIGEAEKTGGTVELSLSSLGEDISINFKNFFNSRYSVRDFSNEDVDVQLVKDSIGIAMKTPSVCNRQPWKVHLYTDQRKINDLLEFQNGNKGFDNNINKLLIVTVNVKSFTYYESNQLFVDGGLFSMSLLLALHYHRIGTCALNSCRPFWYEKKIIKAGGIPENERVIMMVALGMCKENFRVAISKRKPVGKVLVEHY